jgi:hypothetical protein
MYDGGKIVAGIIIGVIFLTFPIWYTHGTADPRPEVKLPEKTKECNVRVGNRSYLAFNGKKYDMSLQNTCMSADCHAKKSEFCDRCHDYTGVVPYCWDCHIEPEEKPQAEEKH